ncbi:MAG: TetR/AcrR family transcriptional regulator [Inquilinus sp.]|nr:TetR/AcrR family transcriptional regulator [Inquilinus sp.]
MVRYATFDREQVLDKAMVVFWRQGYSASSIQDLVDATGLSRSSLYAAFGDKRGLFLAAVDRYVETSSRTRVQALRVGTDPLASIRRFFDNLVAFSVGEGRRLGCLLTNEAVELAPSDADLERRFRANLAEVETAFAEALGRAQRAGEIGAARDLRALARMLTNSVQGMRVMARAGVEEPVLRDIVNETLAALP